MLSKTDPSKSIARLCLLQWGDVLVTRDQGEPVRSRLLALIRSHETVEVDLNGLEALTPSFVDEVFGKALQEIGRDEFRHKVKLMADSQEVRRLVNLVLSNRSVMKS